MRFRFSLRTLTLVSLLCGSLMLLWQRREPWYVLHTVHEPQKIEAIGFSPSDKYFFTTARIDPQSGSIRSTIYDSESGKALWHADESWWDQGFSPGEKYFGVRAKDIYWSIDGQRFLLNQNRWLDIGHVHFSPKDNFAVIGFQSDLALISLPERKTIANLKMSSHVVFSPDEKWLASEDQNGNMMRVLSTATGQEEPALRLPASWHAAFSPDGHYVANEFSKVTRDFGVRVVDVNTKKFVFEARGIISPVPFSEDSRYLFTHDHVAGATLVWDLEKPGTPLSIIKPVYSAGCANDRLFATDPLRAWELTTGRELWSKTAPGFFSPDGRVAYDEESRELLDGANGEALFNFVTSAPAKKDSDPKIKLTFANQHSEVLTYEEGSTDVKHWRRRRPERWWGYACLFEAWLAALLGVGVVWSLWKDR